MMFYILPNLLDPTLPIDRYFPPHMKEVVCSLTGLVAESEKAARQFLKLFMDREAFSKVQLWTLNEHSSKEDLVEIVQGIQKMKHTGMISDCGMPCLADPGSNLIYALHKKKIPMQVIMGPSAILQALLLSGLSAQSFSFHGYLPREVPDLKKKLLELEVQSRFATQLWIEAPYRSSKMLDIILETLHPKTLLSVAKNLSLASEKICTQSIEEWRSASSFFEGKEPSVFLISSKKI